MSEFINKLNKLIENNDQINQAQFEDLDFYDHYLVHKFDHHFEYMDREIKPGQIGFVDDKIG